MNRDMISFIQQFISLIKLYSRFVSARIVRSDSFRKLFAHAPRRKFHVIYNLKKQL